MLNHSPINRTGHIRSFPYKTLPNSATGLDSLIVGRQTLCAQRHTIQPAFTWSAGVRSEQLIGLSKTIAVAFVLMATQLTSAVTVDLFDGNSSASFDVDSSAGQFSWFVDEASHLAQQAFWYRTGSMSYKAALSDLNRVGLLSSNTNFDPRDDTLLVAYRDTAETMKISVRYVLTGSTQGSGTADIMEVISIVNLSDDPLDITFFQFVDFELDGTPEDESVLFLHDNTVRQASGLVSVSETV